MLFPANFYGFKMIMVFLAQIFMSDVANAKTSYEGRDDYFYSQFKKDIVAINQRLNSVSDKLEKIVIELEKANLPQSFALIPLIESSYNSRAVSHANAAGLWQLMPATANRFGVVVSNRIDQRFDVHLSTKAAVKYLSFLYNKFNRDIALTLAAYNAGEGRVERAMLRAGSGKFPHLTLPKETVNYVKKFHAIDELINIADYLSAEKNPFSLYSRDTSAKNPLINFSANSVPLF